MKDDINIDMGEYEIMCDKDKILWRATEKLSNESREFESIDDLLDWIRKEINKVNIEA